MDEIKWNGKRDSFEYNKHRFLLQLFAGSRNHYVLAWITRRQYKRVALVGVQRVGEIDEFVKCDIYANNLETAKKKAIKVIEMWLDTQNESVE